MTKEQKEKILSTSKLIGAIMVIQSALVPLVLPFLDDYIDSRQIENMKTPQFKYESKQLIDEYLESAEFKLFIINFKKELDEKYQERHLK